MAELISGKTLAAKLKAEAAAEAAELREKGVDTTYEAVLTDMKKRDYDDAHRAASPLRRAADAVLVDTSHDDLAGSIRRVREVVLRRLPDITE